MVTVHPAAGRHRLRILANFACLAPPNPILFGEQFRLRAIRDDDLILAGRMVIPPRYHTEFQQHLLHVSSQLLAAR